MKSEKNSYNDEIATLIENIFDDHDNGLLSLVCIEVNNEVVVGFVENDVNYNEVYDVILPVHLIEYTGYDEFDTLYSSYKFHPYKQMANKLSDLQYYKKPNLVFTPSDDILDAYVLYWLKITHDKSCESDAVFGIMSSTKS